MSGLWSKRIQQQIATVEWVGRQEAPFEAMDAQQALGYSHDLVRTVLRDMEDRGLVQRRRGTARTRVTRQGGAVMWAAT